MISKMTTKWPETVPIRLRAADMTQHKLQDGEKCCLTGWLLKTFPSTSGPNSMLDPFFEARGVVLAQCISISKKPGGIATQNDEYLTRAQAARAWNNGMFDLGYTEVQDD